MAERKQKNKEGTEGGRERGEEGEKLAGKEKMRFKSNGT